MHGMCQHFIVVCWIKSSKQNSGYENAGQFRGIELHGGRGAHILRLFDLLCHDAFYTCYRNPFN